MLTGIPCLVFANDGTTGSFALNATSYTTNIQCSGFSEYSPYAHSINFSLSKNSPKQTFTDAEASQPYINNTDITITDKDGKQTTLHSNTSFYSDAAHNLKDITFTVEKLSGHFAVQVAYKNGQTIVVIQ